MSLFLKKDIYKLILGNERLHLINTNHMLGTLYLWICTLYL